MTFKIQSECTQSYTFKWFWVYKCTKMPNKFKGNMCQDNSAAWRIAPMFSLTHRKSGTLHVQGEHPNSSKPAGCPFIFQNIKNNLPERRVRYLNVFNLICWWCFAFCPKLLLSACLDTRTSTWFDLGSGFHHVCSVDRGHDCGSYKRPSLSPPLHSWFQSPLTLKHSSLVLFQRCAAGSTWTLSPACVSMEM